MEYNENRKTIITEEKMMEQAEKKTVTQNAEKYIREVILRDVPAAFFQGEFLRRLASSRYPENLVSRMFAIPKKRFAATSSVRPEQLRRDL